MVSFKKLFVATSLLLSGVAAAPASAGAVGVSAPESRAVNDFGLDARAKKCKPTKRDGLERRKINDGKDANKIGETETVSPKQISDNHGKATVVNLSGCTATFFYLGTTLRRVAHITCGQEEADGKTVANLAAGADSVTIAAAEKKNFDAAVKGIHEAKPNLKINPEFTYDMKKVTDTVAVEVHGETGKTTLTQGTGPRQCEPQ